jgi:hypothetical protein
MKIIRAWKNGLDMVHSAKEGSYDQPIIIISKADFNKMKRVIKACKRNMIGLDADLDMAMDDLT